MGEQPAAGKDKFPGDKAEDRDYDIIAALSSIPSIGKAWAYPADDPEYHELSVLLAHRDFTRNSAIVTSRTIVHKGSWSFTIYMLRYRNVEMPCREADPTQRKHLFQKLVASQGHPPLPHPLYITSVLHPRDTATVTRKVANLEIPEEVHGSVFNDGFFGYGFTWSADERYIAYCAEDAKKKDPRKVEGNSEAASGATGNTDGSGAQNESQGKTDTAPKSLEKKVTKDSELVEDWGEKNSGKRSPTVFVLDTVAKTVQKVDGQSETSSYGQPHWTPEGGLLMTQWPFRQDVFPHLQFKVGLSYCFNRNCGIVYCPHPCATAPETTGNAPKPAASAPADTAAVKKGEGAAGVCVLRVTPALRSWQEPRVSPDGKLLLFISHEQACNLQTHSAGVTLHSASWRDMHEAAVAALADATEVTLDQSQVVGPSLSPTKDDFPGLYSFNLAASLFPANPFLSDTVVLINTLWRSTAAVVAVNVVTGDVVRLSPPSGSFSVLLNENACVYAASTSLSQLPAVSKLRVLRGEGGKLTWEAVCAAAKNEEGAFEAIGAPLGGLGLPASVQQLMDDVSVLRQTTVVDESSGAEVESIVYRKKSLSDVATPGVLFMHGGPHAAVQDAFVGPLLALVAEGYTVVLPNYRGSAGYGEAHLKALPGHAGTTAISAGLIDAARVVVTGGSHGGFLTGHMVGQYPDTFRAAVMRNPVLNIPLMVHLSDIPDWCSVEVEGCAQPQGGSTYPPSQAVQARMHAASPIAHIDAVQAPVMLMLGLQDRRVPPADGLAYARALRSRGKAVQVHVFKEDSHALDQPETAFVQWPRILAFFRMHLQDK